LAVIAEVELRMLRINQNMHAAGFGKTTLMLEAVEPSNQVATSLSSNSNTSLLE
jgi:ACT domain-containing protein